MNVERLCPSSKDVMENVLEELDDLLQNCIKTVNAVTSELIGIDTLQELKHILSNDHTSVYFGKTLRDMKLVIRGENATREHEVILKYQAPGKLVIVDVKLPSTSFINREFKCIDDIIETLKKCINQLDRYFFELDCLDRLCTVMEPLHASFKDNYRRILLDDRTWLHVEVTPEGYAYNIHLVGQSTSWQNKLQSGLLIWDHDQNIVDNILKIFDLNEFPQLSTRVLSESKMEVDQSMVAETPCSICLCVELPDVSRVPLPICQNPTCGSLYHRSCLYQWLVAYAGGRPPAFGVASGACPTCSKSITCYENDT